MVKLTHTNIEAARAIISQHVCPTPQMCWPLLCEEMGTEVWVKHENHTPIGAFKVRGGLVYLDQLVKHTHPPKHLITATRGNHGQSIPFAARHHGISVTVLVPHGNSVEKNAAMRAWGAQVVEFGADFDAAREEAGRRASAGEGEFVPSFHEDLIRGVATYAHELMTSVNDLDVIYCPIGMGSGIASLVAVRDLLGIRTQIVGVVSAHADAMAQTIAADGIVSTETANTFADGMATRFPNQEAVSIIRQGVERLVRVSDDEVASAIRRLYRCTHNVAEGAGAAACAAAYQERQQISGKRIAVILTGGNIDRAWFVQVLNGETPKVGT